MGSVQGRVQELLQHSEAVSVEDLVLGLLQEFPRVPLLTHRDTMVGRLGNSDR